MRIKDKSESLFYKLTLENSKFLVSIVTHTELYFGKSIWESDKASQELKILFPVGPGKSTYYVLD